MIRALHAGLETGELSRLEIESRFLAILTQLIDRHADPRPVLRTGRARAPRHVGEAREYIDACYAENLSVHDLASVAHLSPFHFIRVFQKHMGMPPHTPI